MHEKIEAQYPMMSTGVLFFLKGLNREVDTNTEQVNRLYFYSVF